MAYTPVAGYLRRQDFEERALSLPEMLDMLKGGHVEECFLVHKREPLNIKRVTKLSLA